MLIAIIYPIVHLVIAWLTAKLAAHKGYSGLLWFLLSLPLPGITALVLLWLPDVKDTGTDPKTQRLSRWVGNVLGVLCAVLLGARQ